LDLGLPRVTWVGDGVSNPTLSPSTGKRVGLEGAGGEKKR
jgi:hypothetical protein